MNKRQTTIVSIFVLFAALLTLCGCKDNEKEIIDLARSNIENELSRSRNRGDCKTIQLSLARFSPPTKNSRKKYTLSMM